MISQMAWSTYYPKWMLIFKLSPLARRRGGGHAYSSVPWLHQLPWLHQCFKCCWSNTTSVVAVAWRIASHKGKNMNIKYKVQHNYHTVQVCQYLSDSLDLSRVRRHFQKMFGRQTDKQCLADGQTIIFWKALFKRLFTPPSFFSAIQNHQKCEKNLNSNWVRDGREFKITNFERSQWSKDRYDQKIANFIFRWFGWLDGWLVWLMAS